MNEKLKDEIAALHAFTQVRSGRSGGREGADALRAPAEDVHAQAV